MKMTTCLMAALIVSTAAFAQKTESSISTHGSITSTAAKSETEVEVKGSVVNSAASINAGSKIEVNRAEPKGKSETVHLLKTDLTEQKSEFKASIKDNQEARREELAVLKNEFKADLKANLEASKAEIKELKSDFKANKDASLKTANALVKPSVNIRKSLNTSSKLRIRPVHASTQLKLRSKLRAL